MAVTKKNSALEDVLNFIGNSTNQIVHTAQNTFSNIAKSASPVLQQTNQPIATQNPFSTLNFAKNVLSQKVGNSSLADRFNQGVKSVMSSPIISDVSKVTPGAWKTAAGQVEQGLGVGLKSLSDTVAEHPFLGVPGLQVSAKNLDPNADLSFGADKQLKKQGQKVSEQGQKDIQKATGGEELQPWSPRWVARGLAQNAPSFLASLGSGIATGLITKNPEAALAVAFGTAYPQNAGQLYEDAKKNGADEQTAQFVSNAYGMAGSLLDATGIGKILDKVAGKTAAKLVTKEFAKNLAVNTFLGSSTNSVQQILQNSLAKAYYDHQRDIFAGVPESAFFGGVMGGIASGGTDIALELGRQKTPAPVEAVSKLQADPNTLTGDLLDNAMQHPVAQMIKQDMAQNIDNTPVAGYDGVNGANTGPELTTANPGDTGATTDTIPVDQPSASLTDTGGASGGAIPQATQTHATGRPYNADLITGAQTYNDKVGLPQIQTDTYVPVNEARAREIAKAYDDMPKDNQSPEVIQAYAALAKEVQDQWDYAQKEMGITFEPWKKDGQPYKTSTEMMADVQNNKHLYFFTGGEPHSSLGSPDGNGITLNDKLRAIHDLFGHAAGGYGFGPKGEENAWVKHSQMFSPDAQKAITTETRGQNSWVNFGPHNYDENGNYLNIPPADRPYAEQKVGLLPEQHLNWQQPIDEHALSQQAPLPPDGGAPESGTPERGPEQPKGLKTPIGQIPTDELYARLKGSSRYKDAYKTELTRRGLNPENPEQPKERGLVESVRQNENNRTNIRENVQGTRTPTTDDVRIEAGRKYLAENPTQAKERIYSNEPVSEELASIYYAYQEKLQSEADAADQAGNHEEALAKDREATDALSKLAEKITPTARTLQFIHIFSQKTPQGMVRWAENLFEQANRWANLSPTRLVKRLAGNEGWEAVLTDEKKAEITTKMREISKMTDPTKKQQATKLLMQDIAKPIPPSVLQYTDAYRYQNMLIGPRTQLRNLVGNLVNGGIIRPATIGIRAGNDALINIATGKERTYKLSDVPRYYYGMLKGGTAGIKEVSNAWNGVASLNEKLTDTVEFSPYSTVTQENLPAYLTVAGRLLETADRFNTELIANGEYAINKSHGIEDSKAKESAYDTAAHYLYRKQLDPSNNSGQGKLLSAIDGATETLINSRKKLGILGWFVPFVRVPMAVAKMSLEYNPITGPATLIGNMDKATQIAKMQVGAVAMAAAASAAMNGNTSWASPTDQKEKQLFYDTGRKPYSIKIGDKWIPFQYFGPLGLAMAMPAAAKYYSVDEKNAEVDDAPAKMLHATQAVLGYFSQTTPLAGLGGFVKTAQGDIDYSVAKNIAFTLGQLIPANALISYVNQFIDPVYRKSSGFTDQFKANIPGLSTGLKPYTTSDGTPVSRTFSAYGLPYTLGTENSEPEARLKMRQEQLQSNALKNKEQKDMQNQLSGEVSEASTTKPAGNKMEQFILGSAYNVKDTGLTDTSKQMLERSRDYNYLAQLQSKAKDLGIDDSVIQSEMARKGISKEDLFYDQETRLPVDIKTNEIETAIGNMGPEEMMQSLAAFRKVSEGSRSEFLTTSVITQLQNDGFLDKDQVKALKGTTYDLKTKSYNTKEASSGGSTSKSKYKFSASVPKAATIKTKLPSISAKSSNFAPIKVHRAKLAMPKITAVPPKLGGSTFKLGRITPQVKSSVKSLSGLGRAA